MTWREARPEERQLAWMWGVAAAGALVLRPLWLAVAPGLPACTFRNLTGIPCPTCGSTHAAVAFLHGQLAGALAANPLVALLGLTFVAGGLAAPVWAAVRAPLPSVAGRLPLWWRAGAVAVLAANWAYVILRSR